jgi:osmoprotectant transport system ATP-binding protein
VNDSATEFHDVSLRRGDVVALENVSLKLKLGQTTAILGESGSGKSTLVQLIIGLLHPDSGTVKTLGSDIDYDRPGPLRKRIGYAIQDVALFPHLRIRDNIVLPGRLSGWSETDRTSRLKELLDLMQLPEDVLDRYPHVLSGGHARNPDRAVLQRHGASAGRPAHAEQRSAGLNFRSLS